MKTNFLKTTIAAGRAFTAALAFAVSANRDAMQPANRRVPKGVCLPLLLLSFLLTQGRLSAQTVTVSSPALVFGVAAIGQTKDATATYTVDRVVTVDTLTITGANAIDFKIVSNNYVGAHPASNGNLGSISFVNDVVIRFTRSAAANSVATLNIPYHYYNSATRQTIPGLTTVALTGTIPYSPPKPPSSLDFGTVALGQTKDLSFSGQLALFVYVVGVSVTITGPNAGDFQIVSQNFVGSKVGYTVVVRFQPTAGGTRSATLSLKSDHPFFDDVTLYTTHNYSTTNISLTGRTPPIPHTLLWQNSVTGDSVYWQMLGAQQSGGGSLPGGVPPNWKIVACADVTGDGQPDILWQDSLTGDVVYWQMNGTQRVGGGYLSQGIPNTWRVAAVADITGDGKNDLIWQNRVTGEVVYWEMNGTQRVSGGYLTQNVPPVWQIVAAGDITGDGKTDLIWQNSDNGDVTYWQMNGIQRVSGGYLAQGNDPAWRLAALCDVTDDGQPDLIWQNTASGAVKYWQMNGATYSGTSGFLAQTVPAVWRVVGLN